jgi:hypothetical protein
MTIKFQAEINDPVTEDLLLWLEEQYRENWVLKIQTLRSAEKWLEMRAPSSSGCARAGETKHNLRIEPANDVLGDLAQLEPKKEPGAGLGTSAVIASADIALWNKALETAAKQISLQTLRTGLQGYAREDYVAACRNCVQVVLLLREPQITDQQFAKIISGFMTGEI